MGRSTLSSSSDQVDQSGERFPAIASFSVQGTEYVVVKSPARQCGELDVVGLLKIDGQVFAVGRCSNVPAGGDMLAALSPRELEIARCIAAGYQTKAIAQRLRISYYTVRVHVGRIYCKLGLHKQTELASWISAQYGRQRIDCPPSAPMRQIGRVEEEGFEGQTFPPQDWQLNLLPGNVCRRDEAAALTGSWGLLCQDRQSMQGALIRAGLSFALPVDRLLCTMSWRLTADIKPAELQMDEGLVIHPLAFLAGDELVAGACLRKIKNDEYVVGVMIRSAAGPFRERIDVNQGEIFRDGSVRWELELLKLGTRPATAVVRLDGNVVARIDGDTTAVEPDTACVGILHRYSGLQLTLHVDQLLLTEVQQ